MFCFQLIIISFNNIIYHLLISLGLISSLLMPLYYYVDVTLSLGCCHAFLFIYLKHEFITLHITCPQPCYYIHIFTLFIDGRIEQEKRQGRLPATSPPRLRLKRSANIRHDVTVVRRATRVVICSIYGGAAKKGHAASAPAYILAAATAARGAVRSAAFHGGGDVAGACRTAFMRGEERAAIERHMKHGSGGTLIVTAPAASALYAAAAPL